MVTDGRRRTTMNIWHPAESEGLRIQYAGERQQDGAFGILIGAVVGRFFLVPCRRSAQALSASYANLDDLSPLEDLLWGAGQGYALAAFSLGSKYAPEGVPEDDRETIHWVRLAAEQGRAEGSVHVGMLYTHGNDIPVDLVLAYLWYDLSAAEGVEIMRRNMEIMERVMTRGQIAEARRLGHEWRETASPHGGN